MRLQDSLLFVVWLMVAAGCASSSDTVPPKGTASQGDVGPEIADGPVRGDWPEFRGPTGQGLVSVEAVPLRWSQERGVRWRRELPGKGWSSPILWRGRLYLTTAVAGGEGADAPQALHALCVDASSGDVLWNVKVFDQREAEIHSKNSHASPTPVTDGRHLYVHFGTHGTACLDLDGNIVWRNRELLYDPRHGSGGSPALGDRALFISCDGEDIQFVVALDRETGRRLWKTDRPAKPERGFSFCTPLVIEVDGKRQVVSPGSEYVCSYDPETGSEIWRVHYPGGFSVVPRPLYHHGLVYVCSGFSRPTLHAIRPDGHGDVTETHVVWKVSKGVPHSPSPIVVGDEIFFVNDKGIASCCDARTGELHWRERLGGSYSASPIHFDGRIYFQSEEGEGVVIVAAKTFQVLARNPLGERSLASYAVADGAVFVRTSSHLYRIEEEA